MGVRNAFHPIKIRIHQKTSWLVSTPVFAPACIHRDNRQHDRFFAGQPSSWTFAVLRMIRSIPEDELKPPFHMRASHAGIWPERYAYGSSINAIRSPSPEVKCSACIVRLPPSERLPIRGQPPSSWRLRSEPEMSSTPNANTAESTVRVSLQTPANAQRRGGASPFEDLQFGRHLPGGHGFRRPEAGERVLSTCLFIAPPRCDGSDERLQITRRSCAP